jgi:hypothetical protein
MLHGEPLALTEGSEEARIGHGAWGLEARRGTPGWQVRWRPLHATRGLECRIDALGVDAERFRGLHEATRAWSPFNYALYIRCNRGEAVVGAAYGSRVELRPDGGVEVGPLAPEDRDGFLVESLGLSEAVVHRLPPDRALPPPPGSRTARGEARD